MARRAKQTQETSHLLDKFNKENPMFKGLMNRPYHDDLTLLRHFICQFDKKPDI